MTTCIEIYCFWIKLSVRDRGPYRILFQILFFPKFDKRKRINLIHYLKIYSLCIFFSASSRLFWGNAKLVSHQNSPWKLPKPSKRGKIEYLLFWVKNDNSDQRIRENAWFCDCAISECVLTLFIPAMGGISPYMRVTWQQPVGIGLTEVQVSNIFKKW